MVDQVRASHILVNSEKEAKDVVEKLKLGEKFDALAKKHSSCPSKSKGGDLGWFKKGMMVAPFEEAAFKGEKGKVVGPVKTQFGWHVIYVADKK